MDLAVQVRWPLLENFIMYRIITPQHTIVTFDTVYTINYKTIDRILWDCWIFCTCVAKQSDKVNEKDPWRTRALRKSGLQPVVYQEYHCATGHRSRNCNTASGVQSSQAPRTIQLPCNSRKRSLARGPRRCRTELRLSLHRALDRVSRKERKIVRRASARPTQRALPRPELARRRVAAQELADKLLGAEPCGRATRLADERSGLA